MSVALDPWLGMAFGMQALRQVAAREDGALLGALGVGAEPLPHQIATVERIVTAPEIRHLIADEVGLGKTVQSLMIVNALRLADPDHKTLVVAPALLLDQWAAEFSTRCNITPTVPDDARDDADYETSPVRLIRPETLLVPDFLDWAANHFDLLIVDEPQTLTREQYNALVLKKRDAIVETRFDATLILTATPGFGNPRMRRQIMRLIEPDRTDGGQPDSPPGADAVDPMIVEDETRARQALFAGEGDPAIIWAAQASGRRICRWTRRDWPEITPSRIVHRIEMPPFAAEDTLAQKATTLLNRPAEDGRERDRLSTRAQRLHRLGDPARDAMTELNAPYPPEEGDTRLDALLDRLLTIWGDDPDARVVVVVGDNPTITRLTARLERFFPDAGPIAQIRRPRDIDTETRAMEISSGQLGGFRTGESRLLLIGDWVAAGLNLHYGTREIIFYACPWSVRDVNQLTGRLDRLAKGAERHIRSQKPRREIGVGVIAWQRSPEARVIEGLSRLGVFDRPRAPVSQETGTVILDDLYACAAGNEYGATLDRLSALVGEDVFALSDPVLATANPHTRDRAMALYERHEAAVPPGALPSPKPETGGARATEENALDGWLKAMRVADVFRIASREDAEKPDLRGTLLWYPQTLAKGDVTRPVAVPVLQTTSKHYPNYNDGAVAFVARRRHLAVPPAPYITPENLEERPLRFFDHGNVLHSELCDTLIAYGRGVLDAKVPEVVAYPPGHPFDGEAAPLLVACMLKRGEPPVITDATREAVLGECTNARDRAEVLRQFEAGLAADARWWRRHCPARFTLAGLSIDPITDGWMPMAEAQCIAALDPRGEDKTVGSCQKAMTLAERKRVAPLLSAGAERLAALLAAPGNTAPDTAALMARKTLIAADLAHAVRMLQARKTRDVESNRQVPNVAEGLARRYDARLAATERMARMRGMLLEKGWKTTRDFRHLAIHPRPRQYA